MSEPENTLSVIFWNVQFWGARDSPAAEIRRFDHVVDMIRDRDPDIACFSEVVDDTIQTRLARALPPGYTIHQTAVQKSTKILTLFKNATHRSLTITQCDQFKGLHQKGKPYPLIRILTARHDISILSIHTKSGIRPEDLVIRDEISDIACSVARAANADGSKVVIMGDMNTMGAGNISTSQEIQSLQQKFFDQAGLVSLTKTYPATWHGTHKDAIYPDADLDHVFVSQSLVNDIQPMNETGARLWVGGWTLEPQGAARDASVQAGSDHAPIQFKIRL